MDLGDDRGRGDRGAEPVALDHGGRGHGEIGQAVAVDQRMTGCHRQIGDGAPHGFHSGGQDVEPVDIVNLDDAQADR